MSKESSSYPSRFDYRGAAGQMVIVSFCGDSWSPELETLIREYKAGGFILFRENIPDKLSQLRKLNARIARESLRASGGQLPFISVDEEGGRVSRLKTLIGEHPSPMEVARKGARAVAENYASLGRRVKGAGFNVTWAPILDVMTNPSNPVIGDRAFSDDPDEVAQYGRTAIRELKKAGLFTCGKHFPGHGDTPVDSHLALPVMGTTLRMLRKRELEPFRAAVVQRVDFLMTAHILFSAIDSRYPATFSRRILTGLLRNEMGYNGLVVTDDLNMNAARNSFPMRERIRLSVEAGADLLLIRETPSAVLEFLATIESLMRSGEIHPARVKESLARIRRIKRRLSPV